MTKSGHASGIQYCSSQGVTILDMPAGFIFFIRGWNNAGQLLPPPRECGVAL